MMKNGKSFVYFAWCVHKIALYSDVIYSLGLKVINRTQWWCLKCMLVYLVPDTAGFVMYCVYGESR